MTDVLTDVLASIRLTSRVYARNDLHGPWAVQMPPARHMAFHLVHRGGAFLQQHGERDFTSLAAGDLVVLPHGAGHLLVDHPSTAGQVAPLEPRSPTTGCPRIVHGGTGPQTVLVCGYFDVGWPDAWTDHPLVPLLPPMLHVRADSQEGTPWLRATLSFLADEAGSKRPGTDALLQRLTDVLFIQVLRSWLESDDVPPGWLGAIRDPQVGRALALLHAEPSRSWTVEDLAEAANMSRSAFASRFSDLVGQPPMTYLTRWRMRLAGGLLREGMRVADVAERVGYTSEASFSTAFKRERGLAPSRFARPARG